MNFQDDIPSIPIDSFKDHFVLVFDLTEMQDPTENCHCPELVGEPLRLELNFTYPLEHVTELIVLRERMSSVAVDKFDFAGIISKMDNISLQQIINRNPLLKYRYFSLPLTMFQFFPMRLLLFGIRNPAICRVSIG